MNDLKFVVPDMEKTFGALAFAGNETEETSGFGRTARVESRTYHLFSPVQRADDIKVKIPGKAGKKTFAYEEKIALVNPRIIAEGKSFLDNRSGANRSYTEYLLLADDIVKAEQQ